MADMQQLMDSVSDACRNSRKPYHLSLGALREQLDALPHGMTVMTDTGSFVGREHSYRGYYDDLAFAPSEEHSNVGTLRTMVVRASQGTYTGYKGGEYTYAEDTPLWFAPYGCTGLAIVGTRVEDTKPLRLVLITKNID